MQIYFYEVGFQWDNNAIFLGVVGLMPRAQWLFGRRGTAKDRTRDGFNGTNGRDGANCIILKKVDSIVNKKMENIKAQKGSDSPCFSEKRGGWGNKKAAEKRLMLYF